MASVTLRGLTKAFDGATQLALRDLSLEVRDGEFLVLLGPSGCGKTTALRCIAGLEDPTAGDVLIGDRVVTHLPPADRDVAMVFQNYALYPHLTVHENIAFPLELRGVPTAEVGRRVAEAAARLGLADLLGRRPAELSGGQRQRTALARAIVRAPAVFLLDEPLSNLDANLRIELRAELVALHRALRARPAPADGARPGDRARPGGVPPRRAPLEPRREPAHRAAGGAGGAAPRPPSSASASGRRSPGRSCAPRRCSSSTSPSRTSTRTCASSCGRSWWRCTAPSELGQRQRTALARAIVRAPAVFLLDEPLSNLDANLRIELRAELVALHRAL